MAIRSSPASEWPSIGSESGPAKGSAITRPAVAVQKREAKAVFTTRSGTSSAW